MRNKRLVLLSLIMAALGIAVILDQGSEPAETISAEPVTRSFVTSEERRRHSAQAPVELLTIRPRPSPSEVRDAFATRNWNPTRTTTQPIPEPAATAPPLPFTYLGKLEQGGKWVVFLAAQDQSFIAATGEILKETYLVEQIKPAELVLRYLPTGETQTLSIGSGR